MASNKVKQVEDYVRQVMTGALVHDFVHDFKHVDRVRNWAHKIARGEGYPDTDVVEVAALLHDIGLSHVEGRSRHAEVGAQMAAEFLSEKAVFPEDKINEITEAIRYHSSITRDKGKLLEILRDADVMDAIGAVGLMRAFTSKSFKPEYNPDDIKSNTWGMTGRDIDVMLDEKGEVGEYIIDQINLQTAYYDNLSTETARKLAKPLIKFMRDYVIQLENEIKAGRRTDTHIKNVETED